MKKSLVFAGILCSLTLHAFAQSDWVNDSSLIIAKAQVLTQYYNRAVSNKDSVKFQKLFFQEFPVNFNQLYILYGYKGTAKHILFSSDNQISQLFNKLTDIPEKEYFSKLIKVSIGGKFYVGGISEFQEGVRNHFRTNPELGFDLLNTYPEKEISSFWRFYFDGSRPPSDVPKHFKSLQAKYPKVYDSMTAALKEQQKGVESR